MHTRCIVAYDVHIDKGMIRNTNQERKKQMTKVTLVNDFHNTSTTVQPTNNRLSERQIKRVRRVLCGITGCSCAFDDAGQRGSELKWVVELDGAGEYRIVPNPEKY